VLTGGASLLAGVSELAGLVMEKKVRIGRPLRVSGLADATSGPGFSAAAGLLRFAVEKHTDDTDPSDMAPARSGMRFGRLGQWIRENF